MKKLIKKRNKPAGREKGQALVEYCIVLALVSILALTGLGTMGERTAALFDTPFSSGAASEEDTAEEEENVEEPPEGSEPLKILGENGNLNFVYGLRADYVVGEEYTDNKGKTKIVGVYNFDDTVDKAERYSVTSANFDNSFRFFKPVTLKKLFDSYCYMSAVTNTKNLKTEAVTNMNNMFCYAGYYADSFTIDVGSWNTGNVTDMGTAFMCVGGDRAKTVKITGLGNWNVGNVTAMTNMFLMIGQNAAAVDIGNLSKWNTGKVTDMAGMFNSVARYNADSFDVGDLGGWNVSNVTTLYAMFAGAGENASKWNVGDLSGWDVSNVTNMEFLFSSAGSKAEVFSVGDLSGWDVGNVANMCRMFLDAGSASKVYTAGNLAAWNIANVTNMWNMFGNAWASADYYLDLSVWNVKSTCDISDFNNGVADKVVIPTKVY